MREHPAQPVSETMAEGEIVLPLPPGMTHASSVVVHRTTMPPGARTGWHYHPGTLVGVVTGGTLTHYWADGRVSRHPAGTSFITGGPDHLHDGRNEGEDPLVMLLTYINGPDMRLAVDVPAVCCDTARPCRR
ncbi:cupin domain-containing protein [Streptomyces sp. ISL-11]|uniref:cupin domain-containing protein n=1 Tax=Streptomyces sp. ISL-11 TaxID=2819174 RepID=UPI001BE5BA6B|nr:cupin domain-containing protein [Streptomyces sp. ISL-11]MBT2386071.1 cupin domain-containing protein [Streptomyces sp. ISL-11]